MPNTRRKKPLIVCERDMPVAARRVARSAVSENPVSCRSFDRVDSSSLEDDDDAVLYKGLVADLSDACLFC